MDPRPFKVLSLCAGAGGLDLAVRLAVPTARTVCYVEIEAYACAILAQRIADEGLDDAPVWTDLRTFDGTAWRGRVDCILAGYPCQPFSVAGRKRGGDDPRHLWPSVERVIREVAPSVVFLENVAHHLSLGGYEVIRSLHSMGYETAATLVEATEVGAPHRRQRLFILAIRHADLGNAAGTYSRRQFEPAQSSEDRGAGSAGAGEALADACDERCVRCACAGREALDGPEHAGCAVEVAVCSGTGGCAGVSGWDGRGTELLQAQRQACAVRAESAGAQVADTEHEGREQCGTSDDNDWRDARWRVRDRRYQELPIFPPARDDYAGWAGILARWPELAPAVSATPESTVRGVADGLAYRVDRLRLCGNGVVPHQAALAFSECWTELTESAQ